MQVSEDFSMGQPHESFADKDKAVSLLLEKEKKELVEMEKRLNKTLKYLFIFFFFQTSSQNGQDFRIGAG